MIPRVSGLQRVINRFFRDFDGLPFKVTRIETDRTLINNKRILEKTSDQSTDHALIPYDDDNSVKEVYVPFHSADLSNVTSQFSGRYGIDRVEEYWTVEYDITSKTFRPVHKTTIVTDWYSMKGILEAIRYPFGTSETQIYAGFKYPRKQIEKVLVGSDVR